MIIYNTSIIVFLWNDVVINKSVSAMFIGKTIFIWLALVGKFVLIKNSALFDYYGFLLNKIDKRVFVIRYAE